MHLLLDTSTITPDKTGTGVYTRGMLHALLEHDSVSRITAVGGHLGPLQQAYPHKLEHRFPGRTDWHVLINRDLAGNRPNFKADLAIFPNYFIPPGFSIPSLVTIHDLSFLSHPQYYTRRMRTYYRHRIRHSVRRAEAILTVSRESKARIEHYFPHCNTRVKVIRPGYHLAAELKPQVEIRAYDSVTANQNFIYLGTVEPRKNILAMIDGFQKADVGEAQLTLIGRMNSTAAYENKVRRRIDQASNVHFLGYQPDEAVRSYLSRADGLVNLSNLEGYGFSVLEGLVSRTPCLISRDPALNELANGQAVVADESSISSIAEGFKKLAEFHPAQLNGHTDSLRKHATWSNFGNRLVPFLESIENEKLPAMQSCEITAHPVRQSILEGLAYSAVFEAPVEKDKLYMNLTVKTDYQTFEHHLECLVRKYPNIIQQEGSFYSLKPHAYSGKQYISEKKQNAAFIRKYRWKLKLIDHLPWVKGLYFSGGSVHGSQLERRDLDLFVVSAKNRVWLVYTMLKLLSKLFMGRSVLCYNYLVDTQAVTIHYEQDYFTAHQLLYLKPALPDEEYPSIRRHNKWIKNYFPNNSFDKWEESIDTPAQYKSHSDEELESLWRPGNLLNCLLMGIYSLVWKKKGLKKLEGGLMWDTHRIKLHTNDHRPWIYKKFREIMNETKIRIKRMKKFQKSL